MIKEKKKMVYEIAWANKVDEDLKTNDERFFLRLVSKLQILAEALDPFKRTEKIIGFPEGVRKLRIGEYRAFLYIRKMIEVIYCLAVKHRKDAYKTKTLNEVLTIYKKVS